LVGTGAAVIAAEGEVVGLAGNAASQATPAEKATGDIKKISAPAAVKKQTRQVTGLVTEISGNHLGVKKGDRMFALKVEDGIVVQSRGAEKSLADLKVGDKIMVKYVENGGVRIARSIHLKTDAIK